MFQSQHIYILYWYLPTRWQSILLMLDQWIHLYHTPRLVHYKSCLPHLQELLKANTAPPPTHPNTVLIRFATCLSRCRDIFHLRDIQSCVIWWHFGDNIMENCWKGFQELH